MMSQDYVICIYLRQLEAFNADIANSLVNEASGGDVRKPLDLQDHCPGQLKLVIIGNLVHVFFSVAILTLRMASSPSCPR